jgi:predicted translin family RNA/ssDNA-binding protein
MVSALITFRPFVLQELISNTCPVSSHEPPQNERRERLIISSRQITSLSKKLIFHLHRISLFPKSTESNSSERSKILDEAEEKIDEIRACVNSVGDDLKGGDVGYWAYARNM